MKSFFFTSILLFILFFLSADAFGKDPRKYAKDGTAFSKGTIKWNYDIGAALKLSKKTNKKVLLFATEVPGCHACIRFGKNVLSDTLLDEAIESEFIPLFLAVGGKKNKNDKDRKLLKTGNLGWQAVRILSSDGKDFITKPKTNGKLKTKEVLAMHMIEALKKNNQDVPNYLLGLIVSPKKEQLKEVTFKGHCYWDCEVKFGALEGVLKTEAGKYNKGEATRVWYDESKLNLSQLNLMVKKEKLGVSVKSFEPSNYSKARYSDQKHAINKNIYSKIIMTEFQAMKANAFFKTNKGKAMSYLSPRQIITLNELSEKQKISFPEYLKKDNLTSSYKPYKKGTNLLKVQ
ncbi:MAG: hypothetical protein COA79_06905 [Planctomycetota bacterium]|nr:MAG: hypothetical protein COA79_06905 [Planctomycetota bacterium]